MSTLIIIPARMESSRFPGKPLAKILGMPMIQHVYNKSLNNGADVIVATCNNEIKLFIEKIGGKSILTKKNHTRATDRCAEAVIKYEKKYKKKIKYIIMVQGDEPLIKKNMIKKVIYEIKKGKEKCINLFSYIKSKEEFLNPDCIKVVTNKNNYCLYMSRQAVPSCNSFQKKKFKKQVCVIGFKKQCLMEFYNMDETFLEIQESVDMLRLIENNIRIKMIITNEISHAVDRKEDILKIEKILKLNANN
jgi:3-deoxy-manno-octulosonate cytidylyltransferase (CMP-KDO synthetase)